MAVSYLDLSRVHKPWKEDLLQAYEDCVSKSDFILGPHLKGFEDNFARQLKSSNAVGVGSGADAMLLTLQAVSLEPGDEVVCPAYGSPSIPNAIMRLGGMVVFVDINENMTIDVENVRAAMTEKTKAIITPHLFGLSVEIDVFAQIAGDYGIYLIEDCSHACGGEWDGRPLGTIGIAGCFDFDPSHNLGAMGDGGLVLSDSDELAERIRCYRNQGQDGTGQYITMGYASRLDSMQSAFLDLKLASLREDNEDRVANASYYNSHLSDEFFYLPPLREDGSHVYQSYTIRHGQRDALQSFLAERQIETVVSHPQPLHLLPCYEFLGYKQGHFAQSETAAATVLSLPIYPGLTRREVEEVVHTLDLYVKTHPVEVTPSS